MGLFSIFDSHESQEDAAVTGTGTGDDTNKPSPSLDLPCVVQLYKVRPVRLEAASSVPPYAMLSYSAVALGATKEEASAAVDASSSGSPSKRPNKKAAVVPVAVPDLGVWNVCVNRPGSDAPLLLPPKPAQSTFCLTVDLSDPRLVEPTLSALQDALVRYLLARPPPPTTMDTATAVTAGDNNNDDDNSNNSDSGDNSSPATSFTTSLYDLRTVSFGLAAEDADSAAKLRKSQQAGTTADSDRAARVALVICARRAPPVGKSDYRAKQAQALLYYHLRRHAAALRATLCFVDDGSSAEIDSLVDDDPNDQPVVDPAQLAYVFRELATRAPLNPSAPELGTGESSAFAFVYTAANHNPELVESVLLRNAHYPGEWDAAKESLWKVLPPPSPSAPEARPDAPAAAAAANGAPAGDDPWLAELRDSVAAAAAAASSAPDATKTPAKAARKEVTPDSAQKDAAVSSFFESLLK
jgi:hypothetical protein